MERSLYISKFRNIGLGEAQKFVLNNSLKKGKMGNLVIVIGANNSGKSNVLDALSAFGAGKIATRDVTTLSFEEEDRKPKLTLSCKTDENHIYSCSYTYGYNGAHFTYPEDTQKKVYKFSNDLNSLTTCLETLSHKISRYYGFTDIVEQLNKIIETAKSEQPNLTKLTDRVVDCMSNFFKQAESDSNYKNFWTQLVNTYGNYLFVKEMVTLQGASSAASIAKNKYLAEYGIELIPHCVKYEQKRISNNDLSSQINNIASNTFLMTVLEAINLKIQMLETAYNTYKTFNNKGALVTLEKDINKRLIKIAADFNRLYFLSGDEYSFGISLETTGVFFSLYRGNKDIILDYQSTGFRWFFDLYFNLLCKNSLIAGDILIMDEPATNLHVKGQMELRSFLKDFAIKNDITIVLATHSPFLVDLEYLDEIRVIRMKDNESIVLNDFSAIDPTDPDSLKPIKEAFTVNNHILLDPDRKVVFVEGITDYNYLLAFKKLLKISEDIAFLPIEGIGDIKEAGYKDKQFDISKSLITIKKHNPILIVDGDGAGKSMKHINSDSELTVISLTDIDSTFKTIESLFAPEDLKKLELVDSKGKYIKKSSFSAVFKTFVKDYKLSEITKNNFVKIFKYLTDL